MSYLIVICCLALIIAASIYIGKAWNKAKERREVFMMLHPFVDGVNENKVPSVLYFLFKD